MLSSRLYYIILLVRAVKPDVMTLLGDPVAHTFVDSMAKRQSELFS